MIIKETTVGTASISASGDTAILKGEIDMKDPGSFLGPFFEQIAQQMGDTVRLDFTELEFLNSSGIKCLVAFVLSKPADCEVIFAVDKARTWQKTSFEVIQSLNEESIVIEEK